jgi:hypothetical protein
MRIIETSAEKRTRQETEAAMKMYHFPSATVFAVFRSVDCHLIIGKITTGPE